MRLVISRRLTFLLLAPLLLFSYSLLYSISLLSAHYSTASIIVMTFGKRREESKLFSVPGLNYDDYEREDIIGSLKVKCLSEQLIGESHTDAGYHVCEPEEIASQHSNCVCEQSIFKFWTFSKIPSPPPSMGRCVQVCSLNDGGDISFEKELNEAIDERCRIRFYTPVTPTSHDINTRNDSTIKLS